MNLATVKKKILDLFQFLKSKRVNAGAIQSTLQIRTPSVTLTREDGSYFIRRPSS